MALMHFFIIILKNKQKKTDPPPPKKVIDALGSWEFELLSYGLGVRKVLQ